MAKKTISNTFTINTIEDGESAPYYFQEWFAWSNDVSTSSVTTPPTISGSWETSIPSQGSYAYLWRKSIRYVWNESTRQYSGETAQYVRMTGTNGTSINAKGAINYAYSSSSGFPTASSSLNGKKAIAKGDNRIWECQQVAQNTYDWVPNGGTASDGFSYTIGEGNFNGTSQSTSNLTGHLVMWSTEAADWLDLGQFKGEAGVTYYAHIAWAEDVRISAGNIVVTGFVISKLPTDTTHIWMGTYVDTNSSQDPRNASLYVWSNTKGDKGDRGNVGRFFYFGGVWEDIALTDSFVINDAQAPYFEHTDNGQKRYHVYNPENNPSGGYITKAVMAQTSFSNKPWEVMTNDFKYIITEALFSSNAHLGSFVINGDWMISQHGVIYDTNGGVHTIDDNSSYSSYTYQNAYALFAPDYPNSSKPSENNFVPNYAVNGKTGNTYQNAAYVRGTVMAENLFRKVCFVTDGGIYSEGGSNTGSADLVILVQTRGRKWTYDVVNGYGTVYIPNPEDYQGKSIEIRHTVAPSNSDSACFLTLDEDLHFAIGLAYSNGSFEASTIQSQLMVSYGTTVTLQSVNIGDSWYWLKVPS